MANVSLYHPTQYHFDMPGHLIKVLCILGLLSVQHLFLSSFLLGMVFAVLDNTCPTPALLWAIKHSVLPSSPVMGMGV